MIHNPVIPGFNPDPSVCFDGSRYFIAVSTFDYAPSITLYVSKDLSNFEFHSSVLYKDQDLMLENCEKGLGFYAPTIRYHNGTYYVVCTNKNGFGNFVTHTNNIDNPDSWCKPLFIHRWGIDPSLFFCQDGTCIYTSNYNRDGVQSIVGAPIDPDTGKLLAPFTVLSHGITGCATEAPHIYEKDGYYYLFMAEGGTERGHHEIVARSKNILGFYEEMSPFFFISHRDRKGHEIQATGHCDITIGPDGNYYAFSLAVRMPGRVFQHNLGRETFMAPVTWTKDGWPICGQEGFIELKQCSNIESNPYIQKPFCFNKPLNRQNIFTLRYALDDEHYCLKDNNLTLKARDAISVENGHPTLLLLRQTDFNMKFSATIDTSKLKEGDAGGLTVFYNKNYSAMLEVSKNTNSLKVQLKRNVHDLSVIQTEITLNSTNTIELSVISDREFYKFFVNNNQIGTAPIANFCTEAIMFRNFTGTLFGLYCDSGNLTFTDNNLLKIDNIE
ncbi:MAG: family 43 glycosylhydrolase [Sphaerochaetaceae bacterium]|nr:family 43 glycosylhydrolase [Sphaerochaetaceae bacterium]